jgi:Domain of unknown function (DUF6379)
MGAQMNAQTDIAGKSAVLQSRSNEDGAGDFLSALRSRPPVDRAFLSDEGFRNAVHQGRKGFELKVRLTSYRSLPLSCIEGIELSIDGRTIVPSDITLILDNHSYKLVELRHSSNVWWFILDFARLFVARESALAPGEHDVEGTLITVEPYITSGRFSFFNTSKKRLCLEAE